MAVCISYLYTKKSPKGDFNVRIKVYAYQLCMAYFGLTLRIAFRFFMAGLPEILYVPDPYFSFCNLSISRAANRNGSSPCVSLRMKGMRS